MLSFRFCLSVCASSSGLGLGLGWGYIEAYAHAKATGNPQIEYDVNKFYKTAAYYTGNLAIIFNVAPTTELRAIGTAIVFFIDILGSVLGKIVSPPKG